MKKLFILLSFILLGSRCFAFDIVYPSRNYVSTNAKSTFFIGSSDKPLKINGKLVPLHSTGAFAYVVDLNLGANIFDVQSENERKIYVIVNTGNLFHFTPKFIQFDKKKFVYVNIEGSPLRSTPVDGGINRMAHLQKDIPLMIDGEKGAFYRVVLNDNKFGWIMKSHVKHHSDYNFELAEVSGYDYIDNREYFTFVFHLDRKVPFEIIENDQLKLIFYNTKNKPDNMYVMDFPIKEALNGKRLIGYSYEYKNNDFVWKIRKPLCTNPKKPLKGITIALDAGHGGSEIGTTGCLGHKEKDIVLLFAKNLENELKNRGANVIMTRVDDSYVGLKQRVDIANSKNAVVFLSIHGNALPDGFNPNERSGVSVYYYYNQARPLAEIILNTVTSQLHINNDKVRQESFQVVRNTNALSLLIETGYLINPDDNEKLINPEFQKRYAKAIADAVEKYFSSPQT